MHRVVFEPRAFEECMDAYRSLLARSVCFDVVGALDTMFFRQFWSSVVLTGIQTTT